MRILLLAAPWALAVPASAAAQTMNAEVFHQRADALQRKGPAALFHRKEINALMNEVQAAGEKARQARLAAVAAGTRPRYCPPAAGKTGLGSSEFMKRLAAIPAAERRKIDMTEATVRVLAGKFPCRD